jgi:hypothetical protein
VVPFSIAQSCGSNDESAIRNCIRHALKFLRMFEHRRGAHGRTGLAKGQLIRIHNPQSQETEVTHGASGRPKIEWIACGDQDHTQIVGFQ